MEKQYLCHITGSIVPAERVEALREMGVSEDEYTIVTVSTIGRKHEAASVGISKQELEDDDFSTVVSEDLVG